QRIITQSLKKGCWQVATILTAKSYIFYLPNTKVEVTNSVRLFFYKLVQATYEEERRAASISASSG
ncbi:hypothetical protein, partial [Siminovitchia fordii]